MPMTAFARLEQFRIDIEKLLSEKSFHEAEHADTSQNTLLENDDGDDDVSSCEQAVAASAGRNMFKELDEALSAHI